MMTRIFLVDDHSLLRATLGEFLARRENLEIVGEAGSGKEAVGKILQVLPDIVLMDISLPDADGVAVTQEILATEPGIKVIAVTMYPEEQYLLPFLEAGGRGYINKTAADRELLEAIETVSAGELFLSRAGVQLMATRYLGKQEPEAEPPPAFKKPHDLLSERERQVLSMLSHGYTCRQVGQKIFLSPSTVETYKRRIMEKMGFQNKSEMVEYAISNHIFEEFEK